MSPEQQLRKEIISMLLGQNTVELKELISTAKQIELYILEKSQSANSP